MPFDVKCPNCGGIYYETTKYFERYRAADGRMFRLKEQYGPNGYNWEGFPADRSIQFADLACPNCGGSIVNSSGRVPKLIETDPEPKPEKKK